jgi:hypothetical protein
MQSAEELAQYFVYQITQSRVGIEARIGSAMQAIPQLLEKGWTLYDIKNQLDQFARTYPQVAVNIYHIGEIMDKIEPPNNLMEPDVFYYHNQLRVTSAPTRIRKDETGKMVRVSEPFFLEMKKCYSMKDLMNYWYEQMGITPNDHMVRQDEGKFKYILGNYTIDEVLFSIDAARAIRRDLQVRPLRNAFELDKYIEDGRQFIKQKENAHKMQGINREVKKEDGTEYNFDSRYSYF